MKAHENPFRVERIHRLRFRPLGQSWDELLARLEALNYRAAIIGHEGSGKTTLLEDLEPRLTERDFRVHPLRLSLENRRLSKEVRQGISQTMGATDILLLDGADLLPRLRWLNLKRRTHRLGGLIIAAHRHGLLPTLIETTTTPQLFSDLVGRLLTEKDPPLPIDLEALFHRHGGNIRDALRELYDHYARL